mmetsp:Transcript_59818/g.142456  ORF Transcript_59818/g.142456 Transcript_59818/m.142456 type:complete len:596 (+) Transcript_59818:116-1903(+)
MKFGKLINTTPPAEHRDHYMSYDLLKKAMKKLREDPDDSDSEMVFISFLRHEMKKVNRFAALLLQTSLEKLWEVQQQLLESKRSDQTDQQLKAWEAEMTSVAEMLVNIELFRCLNYSGFRKILKKYDKAHNGEVDLSSKLVPELDDEFFTLASLDLHLLAVRWCWATMRKMRGIEVKQQALSQKMKGTASRTYLMEPRSQISDVCMLLKHFDLVLPTSTSPDGELGCLKGHDWRTRFGGAGAPQKCISSQVVATYYDSADFASYRNQLSGGGKHVVQACSCTPSGEESVLAAGVLQQAFAGDKVTPELLPMATVSSSQLLFRGATASTTGLLLSWGSQVTMRRASSSASAAVSFPYHTLEVSGKMPAETPAWLEDLKKDATVHDFANFSLGVQAISCLHAAASDLPRPAWAGIVDSEAYKPYDWQPKPVPPKTREEIAALQPRAQGGGSPSSTILPKEYLASERTMMEWLHTSLALGVLGTGLWKISLKCRDAPQSAVWGGLLCTKDLASTGLGVYGLIMLLVAICFMWYGVFSHNTRLDCMDRDPQKDVEGGSAPKYTEGVFNRRVAVGAFSICVGATLSLHMLVQGLGWIVDE